MPRKKNVYRNPLLDLTDTICAGMGGQGMSVPDLSIRTGIPKSTIYKRLKAPQSMTMGELECICKALKIKFILPYYTTESEGK